MFPRRSLILFCSAVICSQAECANAQGGAPRIGCAGEAAQAAGKHSNPYPFDVKRILMALERLDRPKVNTVKVLVVDNAFAGYKIKDGSDLPTVIFPETFFYREEPSGVSKPSQFIRDPGDDRDAENWGHGTHVTGLILGGMYGGGLPSLNDLGLPEVRRLFFEDFSGKIAPGGRKPREIVRIFLASLKSNNEEWDKVKLLNLDNSSIPKPYRVSPDIVNLSIKTPVSSDGNENRYKDLPGNFKSALVVVSAGNNYRPLGIEGAEYPAMSDWDNGNLIVVASHDKDLGLSEFSNYGEEYVTLAAPGCAIKSWFSGGPKAQDVDEAKAANGTSQAAAIVSFSAVLLKAYSGIETANDLRERLITSSRYSWQLDRGCNKNDPENPKAACVRWGSVLDIEASLYFDQDMIEYCVDEPVGSLRSNEPPFALGCATRIALGKLVYLPRAVTDCVKRPVYGLAATGVKLSRPAGVRIMPSGNYQVIYRYGLVGRNDSLRECVNIEAPSENFTFVPLPAKDQPDGAPVQSGSPVLDGQSWHIPPGRVVRIVTRSTKDETQ